MAYPGYKSPTIRNVILCGVVVALVWAFLSISPEALKFAGTLFLYLPSKLGILELVTREEAHVIPLDSYATLLNITEPGRYAVYTDDTDLLRATLGTAKAWVTVTSQEAGARIPVSILGRGVRLYDTPVVKGRPMFAFEVETPGQYEFSHPKRDASTFISIVPDCVTGKETVIVRAFVVQIALIVILICVFRHQRGQARREATQAQRQQKQDQVEAFWRARKQEHEQERMKEEHA